MSAGTRQTAIRCTVMRGGTSKGAYFRAADLPQDPATRDAVLLAVLGSPDARQIDGLGGAHPLTSKVAIVSPSTRTDADVDFYFLQLGVAEATVSDAQTCGNLLAGVGAFALDAGYVRASGASDALPIRVHLVNTKSVAVVHTPMTGGQVEYDGDTRIDGVPGTSAPVLLEFLDVAGGSCGALLPTGNVVDEVAGVRVTMIDNGMPVVLMRASDLGVTGYESPAELEADQALGARIEQIRLAAGPRMNLGDVTKKSVPKMCLVAPPRHGGTVSTRTYIPHRVHEAIGVLGAVSVATGCALPGSIGAEVSTPITGAGEHDLGIEHPQGSLEVRIERLASGSLGRIALLRTARLLMRGETFIPQRIWSHA